MIYLWINIVYGLFFKMNLLPFILTSGRRGIRECKRGDPSWNVTGVLDILQCRRIYRAFVCRRVFVIVFNFLLQVR